MSWERGLYDILALIIVVDLYISGDYILEDLGSHEYRKVIPGITKLIELLKLEEDVLSVCH